MYFVLPYVLCYYVFLLLQRVPHQFFDIWQQNGCSKNPKGSPLLHFSALFDLPETSKKIEKFGKFFPSIFSFLRAFVVSSCRKSGFRVLLSFGYGADLGRSRLIVSWDDLVENVLKN